MIGSHSGTPRLNIGRRSKEDRNFWVARFLCELLETPPLGVTASAKGRKAFQEPCNPPGISSLNSKGKIVKLNCKRSTPFPQILDRPTGRCSTKLAVGTVDFRTSVEEQIDNFAMSSQRRIVKGSSP